MGVFDDSKLEQLDWMTQMTETIDSDLNELLARLPDKMPISTEHITANSGNTYLSLSVMDLVRKFLEDEYHLTWKEETIIKNCFRLETVGDVELDARTGKMTGEVNLIKTIKTLSDEELQPLMGLKGLEKLPRASHFGDNPPVERVNEILDILGECNDALRSRSFAKKMKKVKDRLTSIFKENEWRIRDMALANKVSVWVGGYVRDGNLADLTNLCKLKVMTHSNMPIYSVKEEQ